MPIHVLLLRDAYADGHQDPWALLGTADFTDPHQPKAQYIGVLKLKSDTES